MRPVWVVAAVGNVARLAKICGHDELYKAVLRNVRERGDMALSVTPESLYRAQLISVNKLFDLLFSPSALEESFRNRYQRSSAKGIDRVDGRQFNQAAASELRIASAKISSSTFRFSPYLEVLKPKGRDKSPRLIGIPTVRDRVVLGHLHRFLAAVFPEAVPKGISGAYVRAITDGLSRASVDTWICSTDIRHFYDSIIRRRLLEIVSKRIPLGVATRLVRLAIETPTVPRDSRRASREEFMSARGVPQGLAISNILASIYMYSVDESMGRVGVTYVRYVDDVLMYGPRDAVMAAHTLLAAKLRWRGLSLHPLQSPKTQIQEIQKPFGYLGYRFCIPKVTVRDATVERFLNSVASKFSDFRHNKASRLNRFKYLTEDRLKDIFILELNEKITGAVSENRRYGWIAYFSQINDHSLLYRMDKAISGMFRRLAEFQGAPPEDLKRLSRAFWEIKFRPSGSYIRNYDNIVTPGQKLQLLIERGRLDPAEDLNEQQIEERYQAYVKFVLSDMHADEGVIY